MQSSPHPHRMRMWGFFVALPFPLRHGIPLHVVTASLTQPPPYSVRRRSAISLSHAHGAEAPSGIG